MKSIYHKSQGKIKGLSLIVLASVTALNFGCTKNFEEFNSNENQLTPEQSLALLPSAIGPIQQEIFHNYQVAQNLSADVFSGYMMPPTPFGGGINNMNYSMNNGWNETGFNNPYTFVMAPITKIRTQLNAVAPESWGIALVVQIMGMSRVADKFGPMPYTQAGKSLVSTPYDDQKTVYNEFFKQLDTATTNLQTFVAANPGKKAFFTGDLIYGGDAAKWLKLANSLRLRLAMRIVKADPATAKLQAEKAMAATGGLLTTAADNAAVAQSGTRNNDLWTVTVSYGDNALGAALQTYLVGYNDPRLPRYATPATDPLFSGQYVGIRAGANTAANGLAKADYSTYSSINSTSPSIELAPSGQKAPQPLMTAAEVWFLKAEAALRGWTGAGSAQTNYETGITTSMSQWNVTIGSYLSNSTSVPTSYTDPKNSANNSAAVSTITIAWDNAATNEVKLERIITQKWLAIFPDGNEAWAEYRRTGYPKLFTVANNNSGGTINTQTQIRRLPYPAAEYSNGNKDEVRKAVTLLGGADNGGTRLWWDTTAGNF
ncbi:SusD/RagB family nutrient-binding outer membrane lipoprotein [Pedobacter sp. AW1-32]|uniref:SusD/RagB family nutrient-binding outer membrane lipoprotein n=1 Tax=Pedobacter sp. AW1-32 TaxID=3383026 RepID=UPI003FEE18E2